MANMVRRRGRREREEMGTQWQLYRTHLGTFLNVLGCGRVLPLTVALHVAALATVATISIKLLPD